MRVPKLPLGFGQSLVESGGYHVLHADKTGVGRRGVVDKALTNICRTIRQQCVKLGDVKNDKSGLMHAFIQMRAVVVCFNTTFRIRGINMKGV